MPSQTPENQPPDQMPTQAEPSGATDSDPTVRASQARPTSLTPPATDHSRFSPGQVIAERYRVVSKLGEGGMGEVYRADDLRLGQSVALKFLPPALALDPSGVNRLFNEVRLSRQVAHPNVCRIYDVGEVDGEYFISMEYIVGEDLACLIRRIGRIPSDKATQIARQICAGLAAAHDRGILHRDLKPSNIMLDGHGNARITDFGIAALSEELTDRDISSGTPDYMAPEQLEGREVSVRSDIYSLGLVLFEMFSGREAFDRTQDREHGKKRTGSRTATSLSSVVADIDPLIERVINRCLEYDPANRPANAIAVAAALPGGDPLAMALAAGETPSPEMVAQAGGRGGLHPGAAAALAAVFLAATAGSMFLQDDMSIINRSNMPKTTQVLHHDARTMTRSLACSDGQNHEAYWLHLNENYLKDVSARFVGRKRIEALQSGVPNVLFNYRSSSEPFDVKHASGRVSRDHAVLTQPGDVHLQLDPAGMLFSLTVAPVGSFDPPTAPADDGDLDDPASMVGPDPDIDAGPPSADIDADAMPDLDAFDDAPFADVDEIWRTLFNKAGLEMSVFSPSQPWHVPPVHCDTHAAWIGPWPGVEDVNMHVEAGAYNNRPVFFRIYGPWDIASSDFQFGTSALRTVSLFVMLTALALATVGGACMAWKNWSARRGDRRGAMRLALFVFAMSMGYWLLTADLSLAHAGWMLARAFGTAAGLAVLVWMLYFATEPFARRYRPHAIISWSRLLEGRFHDPLVGRDVLIGCAAAAVLLTVSRMCVPPIGGLGDVAASTALNSLMGGRYALSGLVSGFLLVGLMIGAFVIYLLVRIAVGREWIAWAIVFIALVLVGAQVGVTGGALSMIFGILAGLLLGAVMLLFGVLTLIIVGVVCGLWWSYPMTLDFSQWYAGTNFISLIAMALLAAFGYWASQAGRPILRDEVRV